MENDQHKQRNWLILITISLVLLLVIIIVLEGNNLFRKGETPSQMNIEEQEELDSSYESYTTQDLEFSTKYQNSLDKSTIEEENVTATNISYKNNVLIISLERESLCTEDKSTPPQGGFYKIDGSNLILTSLTNTDPSVYKLPCNLSNTYKISNMDLSSQTQNGQTFTVYYKAESGKLYNLNACFYNNHLYAEDAIFSGENGNICECQNGTVICEDNK